MRNGKKILSLLAALTLGLSVFAMTGCLKSDNNSNAGSSSGREVLDDSNVDPDGWT